MLEKVKTALRISSNAFDTELTSLISACQSDLKMSGIVYDDKKDLIATAVIFYCKTNFGNNEYFDRWQKAYNNLKSCLMTSDEFTKVNDNE